MRLVALLIFFPQVGLFFSACVEKNNFIFGIEVTYILRNWLKLTHKMADIIVTDVKKFISWLELPVSEIWWRISCLSQTPNLTEPACEVRGQRSKVTPLRKWNKPCQHSCDISRLQISQLPEKFLELCSIPMPPSYMTSLGREIYVLRAIIYFLKKMEIYLLSYIPLI